MKKEKFYGLRLILSTLVLFAILMYAVYNIYKNYNTDNFVMVSPKHKTLYLLRSSSSIGAYEKFGLSKDSYYQGIKKFNKFVKDNGYDVKFVDEDDIDSLSLDATLYMVDTLALNKKAKKDIKKFVNSGGSLFFNFNSAFSDENGKFVGDKFVRDITGFRFNEKRSHIKFKDGVFSTLRLLSPLSSVLRAGERMDLVLYDNLPIFDVPKNQQPDMLVTGYTQVSPPKFKDNQKEFSINESGILWHGYHGKGKWVYANFPSYSFYESQSVTRDFMRLFDGIVNFLSSKVILKPFPFIDTESINFISEDTEYKFKNFKKFSDLAARYKIPVTAFTVASLADNKDYQEMVLDIAKNPYVEIASHSYSHKKIIGKDDEYVKKETIGSKKILDKYASTPIVGFRPPREELDDKMKKYLIQSGYRYILSKESGFLDPKFNDPTNNILIMPRHGIDDYTYLINLDWSQDEIFNEIIKEMKFIKKLDGLYTLSLHTHLMMYGKNSQVVERYFSYLREHPEFHIFNGSEVYKRVRQSSKIVFSHKMSRGNIIININNNNPDSVKNFTFKLYINNDMILYKPKAEISGMAVSVKKISKNEYNFTVDNLRSDSKVTIFIPYEEK